MINRKVKQIATVVAFLASVSGAHAAPVDQYATSVLGFSFENGPGRSLQALGAPNSPLHAFNLNAWQPDNANRDNPANWIALGFATPVYASGATVFENKNNGYVNQIDALKPNNTWQTVWTGIDPDTTVYGTSDPVVGTPFSWATTSFLVSGLKIHVDSSHTPLSNEQLDAVQLHGQTMAPVPEPETYAMMLAGLGLLGFMARRRKQKEAAA